MLSSVYSFYAGVRAQTPASITDQETLKLIRNADDEKGKETGALILLKDYILSVNEKGQTKMVIRVIGKIYSNEALDDYSEIPLSYNSYYEQATLNYARVIMPDGIIREVPKDAIQIKTMPENEGLQYTDSKYLSFALSGLIKGAAFDYQVTFIQKAPEIDGEWFDDHWFAGMLLSLGPPHLPRIDPVLNSRYTLLVPKGAKFQYHLYSAKADPVKEIYGSQDKYQWIFTNLPAIKIETGMPQLNLLNPDLVISSLSDWKQIDRWATGKLLRNVEVTDKLRGKVNELTNGLKNDDEKIKAISDYIQTNIRYVYADLDRGGYTPHSVNEILSSKYGDCKDQSILFISMLKASGIESFPALINPYPQEEYNDIPTPHFSHLITYIPRNEKDLWLDMTSEVTPFPLTPFADQDREAFIINGSGGKFMHTPSSSAADNVSTYDMQTSFSKGIASINVRINSRGVESDLLKSIFRQLDSESKIQALKQIVRRFLPKADFDSTKLSDVNNPDIQFNTSLKYHLDSAWNKYSQQAFSWGNQTFLPLSILSNVDYQLSDIRHNDLVQTATYTIIGTEKYVPPDKDMLTITIPKNDSLKNDYFDYKIAFVKEGNAITARWSYTVKKINIPATKYKSYIKSIQDLKEKLNWSITFFDPLEYSTSLFKTNSPSNILALCSEALQKDPTNVLAFLIRGAQYTVLKQDAMAVKAFRSALYLAPDNKYTNLYITFSGEAKKNSAFVLSQLNKALELDPEFEGAILERSSYFSGLSQYDKAMADLNLAIKLNPKSFRSYLLKGSLLVRMNKKPESCVAFEEALKIDSSNIVLCQMLAESYLTMDSIKKAIDLYSKAVRIDQNNAEALGNLGWCWYVANNDQKCIEYSLKAASLKPTVYFAKYNIALATLRSGEVAEARNLYKALKTESYYMNPADIDGARKDLIELKAKGKFTREITSILKDFF